MSFSRVEVEELIECIKQNPVIWNWKLREHSFGASKKMAWEKVTDKMKTIKPDVTIDMLKSKWKNLRTVYAAESRKMKKGGDYFYVPSVFYYDKMDFLNEFVKEKPVSNIIYLREDGEKCSLPMYSEEQHLTNISGNNNLEEMMEVHAEVGTEEDLTFSPPSFFEKKEQQEIRPNTPQTDEKTVTVKTSIPSRTCVSSYRKKKKMKKLTSQQNLTQTAMSTLLGLERRQNKLMEMVNNTKLEQRETKDPTDEALDGFLAYLRGTIRLCTQNRRPQLYEELIKKAHEFIT